MQPIKVITLCSGYDAQMLAMRRVRQWHPEFNYDLVAWSEIDKRAILAHDLIHPQYADRNLGDVTKVDWYKVKEQHGCDLLFYSPPCQSVSISGKQAGMRKGTDAASALVWHMERAIDILRPKYLIYENVKNVLSARHRQDFFQWVRTLESYGYESHYQVVDASKYGVPQHRERVFMVSILGGGKYTFPAPMGSYRCINDILEPVGSVPESYYYDDEKVVAMQSKMRPEDVEYCRSQAILGFTRDRMGNIQNYHPKEIANTITTFTGTGHNTDQYVIEPAIRKVGNIVECNNPLFQDTERGRVYSPHGLCRTLKATDYKGPALIAVPPKCMQIAMLKGHEEHQTGRIYDVDGLSPTLTVMQGGNRQPKIAERPSFRVRKVTPRETYRIQDVDEDCIDILLNTTDINDKPLLSKSSHYFLAGNSIAVAPLAYVVSQLFFPVGIEQFAQPTQLSLFDIS